MMRSSILVCLVYLTATAVFGCGGDGGGASNPLDGSTSTPSDASTWDASTSDASTWDASTWDAGTSGADAAQPPPSDSGVIVPPSGDMGFFVTSVGNGASGGNYGGLDGADARCQSLATAVGAGARTWRAYLSTGDLGDDLVVDARDRIGAGPWYNAEGKLVASNVANLHQVGIAPELMLDEHTQSVPRNQHDLLTGSDSQGQVKYGDVWGNIRLTTCNNWTSADPAEYGWVGHTDDLAQWNDSHHTRCNQEGMAGVNGAGRLMCFAID